MTPFPAQLAFLGPVLGVAGIAYFFYRRLGSDAAQQDWEPGRNLIRVVLLTVLLLLFGFAAAALPWNVGMGEALGALCGLVLGMFNLRHMAARWDRHGGHYTPNPWIGGLLAALLIGQLVWHVSHGKPVVPTEPHHDFDPLTMALAVALLAYGLTHSLGLWRRMRALQRSATLVG
ncbi:MAG: hypothetical protein ABW178_08120 [Pseudoxanthomonas sp.]